jgi:hypothetical protein
VDIENKEAEEEENGREIVFSFNEELNEVDGGEW